MTPPAFGTTVRPTPGDRHEVDAAIRCLRVLGIRHVRLPLSLDDYTATGGAAWYDWLLPRLGGEFHLLPCLHERPGGAADFLRAVIERHGEAFDTVAVGVADARLADVARALGKVAVLTLGNPPGLASLRALGESGVLAAFDGLCMPLAEDEMVAICSEYNPGLRVWFSDIGPAGTLRTTAQLQAYREAMRAPVERLYWCRLQDAPEEAASGEGLYDSAGQPRLLARLLSEGAAAVEEVAKLACPAIRSRRPVLVTGGAGFIGSNLVDRLASLGHDVLVFDALARPGVERNLRWLGRRHPQRVSFAIADLRDGTALGEAAATAEAVFHLAGQVAVTTSMQQPAADFEVNAAGTLTLLETLRRRNPTAPLVFASTNKVYGDLADIALVRTDDRYLPSDPALRARGVAEDRPLRFHTPYGCSKGAADQYVLDYAHSFGLRTAVLRMSCIYGERQLGTEDQGWVAHFLLKAIAGEPLTIYGDGAQVRDVMHVGDAVAAYLGAWRNIDEVAGRAYNLGGGPANAISLLQLVAHLETLVGRPLDIALADWRPGDQRYFVADTGAATADLNLAAPLGWREGTARLARHFGAGSAAMAELETTP